MNGDDPGATGNWEPYIRQAATARGIDPDIAVNVAKSEGLNSYVGDNGSSFGPFQLHYGGMAGGGNAVGGLGDVFTKQTGLHASDPSTVPQQINFALDYASQNGWGPWHGWKGNVWQGISGGKPTQIASASPPANPPAPVPGMLGSAVPGTQNTTQQNNLSEMSQGMGMLGGQSALPFGEPTPPNPLELASNMARQRLMNPMLRAILARAITPPPLGGQQQATS